MVKRQEDTQAYEELEKKVEDLEKALLKVETERDIYRECLMRETLGKCVALEDFGGKR